MAEAGRRQRLIIDGQSRPALPRHVKLRHDAGRDRWVMLAPERILTPDEIAVEVLRLCDGERSIEDIAARLALDYNAPAEAIAGDVIALLQDMADKGYIKA
ncbi:MAG: pyrroloquinoline quinone biosynthesis peptide chaperone PqqD [Hyphomicrobiales bacterium]|nr:pyrroloquinoline quinone biosynthesis peptide chaperone PqqD [Hyphomicrobiales bacterium]